MKETTRRKYDNKKVVWKKILQPLLYFPTMKAYNKVKHKEYVDVSTWTMIEVEDMKEKQK